MAVETVKDVMAVLPHRLDDYQRRAGRDAAKYFHSNFLAIDETMTLGGIVGVAALHVAAQPSDGSRDRLLGARLGRPALLVGGEAQISICD